MKMFENMNDNMTTDTLRNSLRALGEKTPSLKSKRAERLRSIWKSEPQRILDTLSEPEIKLLSEHAHEGAVFDVSRVNARYGFSYSLPYCSSYKEANLIYLFIATPDRFRNYEWVSDIADDLRKLLPAPPKLSVKLSTPVDLTNEDLTYDNAERIALTEAKRMLQLVAAGKLKVSEKTRLPTAACIKQVKTILCEEETPFTPERSYAWAILIQQCGWAKPRVGKLFLTRKGKALLENFTPDGYADGIQTMIYDSVFDEIIRAPEIKGMKGKRARHFKIDADVRRENITHAMEDFPANKWVYLKDAFDYIVASGNRFDVVSEGDSLYICDTSYGGLGDYELEIARVYFRILAAESFTTLGLLDSATFENHAWGSPDIGGTWGMDGVESLTRYDSVQHIRLTPLGAFCLGTTTDYQLPEPEKRTLFNVLPNHDIVVTDAAAFSAADAALLNRFAKKTSDSVWKMNKKTIFQGLETGDSKQDILSVLETGSANELPKPVCRLIDETVTQSAAATARENAVAITFRDEPTAALVQNDTACKSSVFCRDGNTLFVRTKNLKKFQGGLRKLGILLP